MGIFLNFKRNLNFIILLYKILKFRCIVVYNLCNIRKFMWVNNKNGFRKY